MKSVSSFVSQVNVQTNLTRKCDENCGYLDLKHLLAISYQPSVANLEAHSTLAVAALQLS